MLPAFLRRYPAVTPDWHFENRLVDLIGEGFDAAIAANVDLPDGVVARQLAPLHLPFGLGVLREMRRVAPQALQRCVKLTATTQALDVVVLRRNHGEILS